MKKINNMEKIFTHKENTSKRYSLISVSRNNPNTEQWGIFVDLLEEKIINLPIESLKFIGIVNQNGKFIKANDYLYMTK